MLRPFFVWEVEEVEERSFSFAPAQARSVLRSGIVESELDMVRKEPTPSMVVLWIGRVRRLLTAGASKGGLGMRSVARELEEAFPSRDN